MMKTALKVIEFSRSNVRGITISVVEWRGREHAVEKTAEVGTHDENIPVHSKAEGIELKATASDVVTDSSACGGW
jgi:hypothetical protein